MSSGLTSEETALGAICTLKYRYLRGLDTHDADLLDSCFTFDAVVSFDNGKYTAEGRDAIRELFRGVLVPTYVSSHIAVHPEIELLTPSTATGVWKQQNTSFFSEDQRESSNAGFCFDEYACGADGQWRFTRSSHRLSFSTNRSWAQDSRFQLELP